MSTIHPAWIEHQRRLRPDGQRWVRHDAHRFAPPSVQTKSFAARRLEQRQAEEQATLAAEQSALHDDLVRLCWLVADLKFELAWRRLCRKYGYNPNQPRVPAGNPDGGQWTSGGAIARAHVAVVDPRDSAGQIVSDEPPGGLSVGAQYAAAADKRRRDDAAIAGTTTTLEKTLIAVSGAVVRQPDVSPREFGTEVHVVFAKAVRAQNLPGIGRTGVEQSFDKDGETRYGKDGSIRTDVVLRNEEREIIAIYDLKTGNATIRPPRASEIRALTGAGSDVPVIELHAVRGPARR